MSYLKCGNIGAVVDTRWNNIWALLGILGGIATGIATGVKAAQEGVTWFTKIIKIIGVSSSIGFVLVGVLVAVAITAVFFYLWWDKCIADPKGDSRCLSGVVETINGDDLGVFPFAADHPSLDLVVKSKYWPVVEANDQAKKIFCSNAGSPILKVFYKSGKVCGAALGAAVGAAIVGAAGVIAGAAAAAAIGCATVILCIFALLVAILIVAAAAIAGAWAGSAIGGAAGDEVDMSSSDGSSISVRDLIKATGPTAIYTKFEGAMIQYWNVTTELLGRTAESPSFTHEVSDNEIPDALDCE